MSEKVMIDTKNNDVVPRTKNLGEKIKIYIFFHLPWQLLAILIFSVSSVSNDDLPDLVFHIWDKLAHFVVFGIFSILMYLSFIRVKSRFFRLNAFKLSVIFASLYGAIDEIHQLFVPGRFASFGDWIADSLGIIVMLLIYIKIFPYKSDFQKTGN